MGLILVVAINGLDGRCGADKLDVVLAKNKTPPSSFVSLDGIE